MSEPEPENAPAAPSSGGSSAGRGVIYIAFAKFYFMIAGAILEFRLTALLSNTVFGAYAVVSSWVSPVNNVLVTGSIQSVSRFTAQRPELARSVQATGLRMHLYVGLPVALLFIAAAPVVGYFMYDSGKTGPMMLAGAIIAGYSFYAVNVGTANGLRAFHKQAALDVSFATLRVGSMLGLVTAGFGLYGAISGWVAAVALILLISTFVIGLPGKDATAAREPVRPMIKYFAGVALYLALLNLIMFVDQLLLKRLATEWFHTHEGALTEAAHAQFPWLTHGIDWKFDPAQMADVQVGYYRAVQNLARLSYQAIIAATFVIFPLISRSTFDADADATRRYIRTTMRYSLIFATALAVVFAANPLPMLDIVYQYDYAWTGSPALIALALGNVAFSMFAIVGTILNGAGLTRDAVWTAAVTLGLAAVGNFIVIPMCDPGREVLLAAATVTGIAMVIGACLGGWVLHRKLGAFVPVLTVVRVLIAIGAAIGVGQVLKMTTPLMTLVEAGVVGVVFLVTLVATRELTRKDLSAVSSIGKRKQKG